jgi:hypothetical protein
MDWLWGKKKEGIHHGFWLEQLERQGCHFPKWKTLKGASIAGEMYWEHKWDMSSSRYLLSK